MLLYGASSPADAWIDNGDGTATHTVTGLMWMRAALGQTWLGQTWTGTTCIGDPKKYSPNEAKKIGHHFAGYSDWRVPTINELMSIVDLGRDGCMDKKIFPNHGKEYYLSNSGFVVRFDYASVLNLSYTKHGSLRMVRSLSTALSLEKKAKFHNNNDGTATDVSTGLTWMRCALGQTWDKSKGVGEPYLLTYQDALSIRHTFASFNDWRVPSIGELNSIVDRGKKTRCADEEIFTNIVVVGKVLSSTLVGSTDNYYYCTDLWNGDLTFQMGAGIILLVRGEYQSSSLASGKSPISISSDNKTKSHQLNINKFGSGSGSITCTPNETSHAAGSLVTLSAIPETGSKFMGWLGDITESAPTFSFAMNSAKTVIAHFARLSFPLVETITGTGSGTLSRTPAADRYDYGHSVTLKALAAEGSIFNGWTGDAEGLNATCAVQVDSAKHVIAEFVKLDIANFEISLAFDSCENAGYTLIIYLLIANQGQQQIHVELPLASYVTRHGEEVAQDAWLSGLLNVN